MIPINNSYNKKGSFKGNPNGFVAAQLGTLFRRRLYEYKILYPGKRWQNYTQFYYEPNQGEYDSDINETLWIKTTRQHDKNGWVKITFTNPTEEIIYLINVGENQYLSVDGANQFITFNK